MVSYNRYDYSVEGLTIPEGADRPIIIGEFHFGALDRGMFHTGLRLTHNIGAATLGAVALSGALEQPGDQDGWQQPASP